MTLPAWHEEPIARSHRRREFDCGDEDMNRFLHRCARQSHELHAAKTFCAIDDADAGRILGFYTVAPAAVEYERVPSPLTRGLARHDVDGYKLARIAVDVRVAGMGLGGQLLAAAALRCLRAAQEVGGVLLLIDAKNERAATWYSGFGAEPLADQPLTLVIPLKTLAAAAASKQSNDE